MASRADAWGAFQMWEGDTQYTTPVASFTFNSTDPVSNTNYSEVFQTERFAPNPGLGSVLTPCCRYWDANSSQPKYSFPVSVSGKYAVQLLFSEGFLRYVDRATVYQYGNTQLCSAAGDRLFDVVLENSVVATNLDIFQEADGQVTRNTVHCTVVLISVARTCRTQ